MAISIAQLHWVAGFLEGEGTFWYKGTAKVCAHQVQREPLDRLRGWFGGSMHLGTTSLGRPIHQWNLCGPMAAGLMMSVYPLLSPRRKMQVLTALTKWRAGKSYQRYRQSCPKGHPYDMFKKKDGTPHRRCSICVNEGHRIRSPRYREKANERRRERKRILRLVPDSRQGQLA